MKAWKCVPLLLVLALVLSACVPFIFGINNLKNLILTYYFAMGGGSNGHDRTIFTFDNTGAAGTFETQEYTHDFPTQAAVTSGRYTDRSWFQYGGYRGTFTYDAKTQEMVATMTECYWPNPTATQMSNGDFAEADYSYQNLMVAVPGATSVSESHAFNILLTQDGFYWVYVPGSAANSWVSQYTYTWSSTVGGVTETDVDDSTETLTVESGTIVRDYVDVQTQTVGSTTDKSTWRYIYNYEIVQNFIVGQEDKPGATFADVWKKGNKATFQTNRTQYSSIQWDGDTPPTAPTIDPTTGIGSSSGSGYSYFIDCSVSSSTFNLTHAGDYIMFTNETDFAARNIARGK